MSHFVDFIAILRLLALKALNWTFKTRLSIINWLPSPTTNQYLNAPYEWIILMILSVEHGCNFNYSIYENYMSSEMTVKTPLMTDYWSIQFIRMFHVLKNSLSQKIKWTIFFAELMISWPHDTLATSMEPLGVTLTYVKAALLFSTTQKIYFNLKHVFFKAPLKDVRCKW